MARAKKPYNPLNRLTALEKGIASFKTSLVANASKHDLSAEILKAEEERKTAFQKESKLSKAQKNIITLLKKHPEIEDRVLSLCRVELKYLNANKK